MIYEPYSCSFSVASAYLVSVGFGEVGSGKGEVEATIPIQCANNIE